MLDNMDMHDREELERRAPTEGRSSDRPLADREVPLNAHVAADSAEAINRWLDGEVSEEVARAADARQVEFWQAVNEETAERARMKTPAHVLDAIMSALPAEAAGRTQALPGVGSKLSLSPLAAAAAAAGFTALGVLIGRVIGR